MSARPKLVLAALALCLAFTGLAASAAQARTAQVAGLPEIVHLAKERAAAEHPDADFYGAEADFEPPLNDTEGVWFWSLNFYQMNNPEGTRTGFSYLYSASGRYLETRDWEWRLGIRVVEDFRMTQSEALDIARQAGYDQPFTQLYLAQPLVPESQPTYYFCFDHETVGVGAETREVFDHLLAC